MSRTVVSGVVALLIVVAIAGIVLAGRKSQQAPAPGATAPAGTTQSAPGTTTAGVEQPPAAPIPTEIRFAGGTDKLPPEGLGELARFADAVRANGGSIGLTARFPAGGDKMAAIAFGRKRVEAVQHALQSNGISAQRIQGEMVEVPASTMQPADANRVLLSVR